jgi:hypothetical protein
VQASQPDCRRNRQGMTPFFTINLGMGPMSTDKGNREDPLRRRAYQLWQEDGMREGEELRYWLEAEKLEAAARARQRVQANRRQIAAVPRADTRPDKPPRGR